MAQVVGSSAAYTAFYRKVSMASLITSRTTPPGLHEPPSRPSSWPVRNQRRHAALSAFQTQIVTTIAGISKTLIEMDKRVSTQLEAQSNDFGKLSAQVDVATLGLVAIANRELSSFGCPEKQPDEELSPERPASSMQTTNISDTAEGTC